MSAITPSTDLYLIKSPLELNDNNQLDFASKTAQANYFLSLPKLEVTDISYLRKDGVIRYPAHIDMIMEYNYVMYRNENYSNKWFYAYITGMEYINDNMTAISIKTDSFQTWQFDLEYKTCFVERETVLDDTIGANILDEGLEYGDYICNGLVVQTSSGTSWYIVSVSDRSIVQNKWDIASESTQFMDIPSVYGKVPSGNTYFVCKSRADLRKFINAYQSHSDAIQSVFVVPSKIVSSTAVTWGNSSTESSKDWSTIGIIGYTGSETLETFGFTRPNSIQGWTPRNNKLLVAPYNTFFATNNSGATTEYKYEDFTNGNPSFTTIGTLCPSCSIKMYPNGYKNITGTTAWQYGLVGAKYPIGSWSTDVYTNWLTQNAVNVANQYLGVGVSAGIGAVSGGQQSLGALNNIFNSVLSLENQKYQAKVAPDQTKGDSSGGDVTFATGHTEFSLVPVSIRLQEAKKIDEFFTMFGYKVHKLKVPSITGRTNWNFVKTTGVYIEGDVPQTDLEEIKGMFDSGITIWHNPKTFMDYNQDNHIIKEN